VPNLQQVLGSRIRKFRLEKGFSQESFAFSHMKPNNRGEDMVPYFKAVYQLVVKDCDRLLGLCSTILREIDQHFPDRTLTQYGPDRPELTHFFNRE